MRAYSGSSPNNPQCDSPVSGILKSDTLAAQAEMASSKFVFDALTADGQQGQMEEQGGGNYYLTDPVESRNFKVFIDKVDELAPQIGKKVLVAGCGDGLETELLVQHGFEVDAFDYSANMVKVTRQRLTAVAYEEAASVDVGDVTDLDLSRYRTNYAGVMFAQVAQFIPPVEGDQLFVKAINDLTSRTPEGVFFMSTTQYKDPRFVRPWVISDEVFGETIYHAREAEKITGMIKNSGMSVVHHEHFDAGDTPPDDYKNDYFVAVREQTNL